MSPGIGNDTVLVGRPERTPVRMSGTAHAWQLAITAGAPAKGGQAARSAA